MEFLLESGDPSQLKLFGKFFEIIEEVDKVLDSFQVCAGFGRIFIGKRSRNYRIHVPRYQPSALKKG